MKYLIVGLGNIGKAYERTRHNIGFAVVDHLAEQDKVDFVVERLGSLAYLRHQGRHIYLLKPSTYMNESGKAIRYWLQKLSIPKSRSLVITDDLHLPLGKLRIRPKGGAGGHNGLKDINERLGTALYPRIRLGIGNDFPVGAQNDYVLGKFSPAEMEVVTPAIILAGEATLAFCTQGLVMTMNRYN